MLVQSIPYRWSLVLLVGTTLVWGTTFPLLKDAVGTLSPVALVGSRFLVAALTVIPFCRPLNRQLLRDAAILGLILFAAYLTQAIGLETTSSNRAAFVTSLNVILVPLLGILLRQAVSTQVFLAAGLALAGIGMMSWEGGSLVIGDIWVLGCAISYAIYILLLESIAPRHNPLTLTAVQLMVVGILGTVWAFPDLLRQSQSLGASLGAIVYLGVIATAVTTWTQAIAQRSVSATETAIIYTLEPVFAAIFAFWWLGESLGKRGLLGAGMVVAAMMLSQLKLRKQ